MVFIGGDILPPANMNFSLSDISYRDFLHDYLIREFLKLKNALRDRYPQVYLIFGNDDYRIEEASVLEASQQDIWHYIHNRRQEYKDYQIYGYSCIPPSPLMLKDWERYDISRFVDPGAMSPEEGFRSVPVSPDEARYGTIAKDLELLVGADDLSRAVFLFHSPPYMTNLDRAALDNKQIDHVPLDVHLGSIAIQRFIREKQPLLTLHGHVHESARLTGSWHDRIDRTVCFSAAHDGEELALISFALENLDRAKRRLI